MAKAGWQCQLVVGSGADARVVGRARDVELSASLNMIDVSTRAGLGWKEFVPGLFEFELSVDQLWVPTDLALIILRDAYLAKTSLGIKIEDVNSLADTAWAALTAFDLGVYRIPVIPNGLRYECTRAGTSGAAEPTWPTTIAATVNDPDVDGAQWTARLAGTGFTGTTLVTSMKQGQPLDGGCMLPVTLKGTGALAKSPAA